MDNELEKLEGETFFEDDNKDVPPSDIVAYNELRSCADLFRMYEQGILEVQPEFQREVVWRDPDQTRFIDSIIKQLPIPSMCFSLDYKSQKWQVIDGLQRISSVIRFLGDKDWKLSNLEDIDKEIAGKRTSIFKKKGDPLYPLYLRVQNLTLPITVLRCDYSKRSHKNYLFTIFHRLNSGGMKLNNQEIRNCIFFGSFNQFLKECNKTKYWVTLQDIKEDRVYRFTKIELVLRFFAFYDTASKYTGKLARFLNDYMDQNRDLDEVDLENKRNLFVETTKLICEKITNNSEFEKIPVSVFEAVMYGVAKNINHLKSLNSAKVKKLYKELKESDNFSLPKLKSGVTDKEKLIDRLKAAENIFSK